MGATGVGDDVRTAALAAGYSPAAEAGGEGPLRLAALSPPRLMAWARALAELHALAPPDGLPPAPLPDWVATVAQPWPVDVAPLLAQAAWVGPQPGASSVAGGLRLCHRRWWLRHVRFAGEALACVGGWAAAGLGDPAGDLASVEVGLVADGASAAAAESFGAAFTAAYTEAGGRPPRGLGAWRLALAGEQLAAALDARERGERGRMAGSVALWARLLGRLLTQRRD